MPEYNITLFEACEILNKSKKTISRYIRRGKLNPQQIKSQQGTLEYRFTKDNLDALRAELARVDTQDRPDTTDETRQTGQTRQDTPPLEKALLHTEAKEPTPAQDKTGQSRQDKTGRDKAEETEHPHSIITLLKETTDLLKGQLTIKDTQIGTLNDQVHKLIERDRETNILLKGLQDRLMLLGPPPVETTGKTGRDRKSRGELARLLVLIALLLLTLSLFFYTNTMPILKNILTGG